MIHAHKEKQHHAMINRESPVTKGPCDKAVIVHIRTRCMETTSPSELESEIT